MSVKEGFSLLYNLLERFGNLDFCWLYSRVRAVFDKPGENEFWPMNKIKDFWWLLKMSVHFFNKVTMSTSLPQEAEIGKKKR